MFEFLIKKRKNPYSDEARRYLYDVINEYLEQSKILENKTNRTLENLLKEAVQICLVDRVGETYKKRKINISDLNKAFKTVISNQPKDIEKFKQIEIAVNTKN